MKSIWGKEEMTPLSKTIRFNRPLVGACLSSSEGAEETKGDVHVLGETLELMPHELEAVKQRAYSEGKKAGQEEAEANYEADLSHKIRECGDLATELAALKNDLIQEMHGAIADLVLEAVGRLLDGWQPDAPAVEAMVEALLNDFDAEDHRMRIRLHHETLELLSGASVEQFKESNPQLEFRGDSRLKPGECVLEGRFGLADARYSEKLKNLSEVLTDD